MKSAPARQPGCSPSRSHARLLSSPGWLVNSIAILLTSVIVPGVILYITLGLFSDLGWLSPLGFVAGLLMFSLHTFYWIALVLMMGTLSESSSVVIAVPMALFFIFWMGTGFDPRLDLYLAIAADLQP